jgi:hypothetical protein
MKDVFRSKKLNNTLNSFATNCYRIKRIDKVHSFTVKLAATHCKLSNDNYASSSGTPDLARKAWKKFVTDIMMMDHHFALKIEISILYIKFGFNVQIE